MKKSELRKIIKEEVKTVLSENVEKLFDLTTKAADNAAANPKLAIGQLAQVLQGVLQEISTLKGAK